MKINDEGYTITGVPGMEYIKIIPSEGAEGGVKIVTKDEAAEYPHGWDLDAAQVFFEAMQRAVSLGWNMVHANKDVSERDGS
jgi:selenophosphate synthetase-related protein